MTFTDEDLKRFKECVGEMGVEKVTFFDFDLQALLARLEAAEKAINFSEGAIYSVYDPYKNDCPICENFMGSCKDGCEFPKFHEAYETWRKAAGRAGK